MSETPPPVLVTGATGRLGRAVLAKLTASGAAVRALSRHGQPDTPGVEWAVGDLASGDGVDRAVAGVAAVVHLASAPYRRGYTRTVEIDGTTRLLDAARQHGIRHLVYTSIIGCDRIPWAYFRTKAEAERLVRDTEVPATVLRLGQFHDFVDEAFTGLARTGLLLSDRGVLAQPVDTADAAERIAALLQAGPGDEIVEFAGPEQLDLTTAARQWLAATGKRRPVLPIRIPGALGAAFRAGRLTTNAEPRGTRSWRDHLAARYGA